MLQQRIKPCCQRRGCRKPVNQRHDHSALTHSHTQSSISNAQTVHSLPLHSFLLTIISLLPSFTPADPPVPPPYPTTTQQPRPGCFSLVFLRQPGYLIGLCWGIPGKPLPSFLFVSKYEYPISTVLPVCCVRLKHG